MPEWRTQTMVPLSAMAAFSWTVTDVSTADRLGELRAQPAVLSDLNRGQINSLLVKVNAAERAFARGNRTAGVNQLDAVLNELEALRRGRRLDPAVADALIAEVKGIVSGA